MNKTLKDERAPLWTLPNRLSLIRILFIPVIIILISTEEETLMFAACLLFIVAGITDGLDGYIARKMKMTSRLGVYLDPIADKLLVTSVLITLTYYGFIPLWVTLLLVCREFIISGLRSFYALDGITIYPSFTGKLKTALQIIGISFILFNVPRSGTYSICDYLQCTGISCIDFNTATNSLGLLIIYIALFFSMFSAAKYLSALFKTPKHNNPVK